MNRFLSRRHQRLMDESEHALEQARQSPASQTSRITRHVLEDEKTHRLWEAKHAKMLLPVAEHGRPVRQIVQLRLMATGLVHGCAFIDYIREKEIRGKERERLFAFYYGPLDYRNAILSAHKDYMLSVSSAVSTSSLISIMDDPVSHKLLREYENVYRQYFEMTSFLANNQDDLSARALTPLIESARFQLRRLRQKLIAEKPHSRCCEFEKQACLARSGRYPAINYMNR